MLSLLLLACAPVTNTDVGDTGSESDTDTDTDSDSDTDTDTDTDVPMGDCTVAADGSADSTTIQGCVDAVSSGETVLVYPGTYLENVDTSGKSITLVSTDGPDATTIDGDEIGSVLTVAGGETVTVEGFTIRGGRGTSVQQWGQAGGGLFVSASSITVRNCDIRNNETDGEGGGIVALDATVVAESTSFRANSASGGGGIFLAGGSTGTFSECAFLDNTADVGSGGAIYVYDGSVAVDRSTFQGNAAVQYGSAIMTGGDGDLDVGSSVFGLHTGVTILISATGTIRSSLFVDNAEAVMADNYPDGRATLENVTIVGTAEGYPAFAGNYDDTLRNSIVYDGEGYALSTSGGMTVEYSLFSNNAGGFYGSSPVGGNGNIDEEPLFAAYYDDGDPTDDDFSLQAGSPAIDAGNASATFNDVDGTRNDMGAFGGPSGDWTPAWY